MRSSSMLKRFKFVDPWNIGHIPSTKKDKKTLNDGMEQRARALANGLDGTLVNQLVLVPCNVGAHWILTVIDPHKEEVGMLDPLYKGIRDGVWKQVVELALKMFSAETMSKGRKKPIWTVIKFIGDHYTELEINEMRKEWAERVQEHIYEF